MDFQWAHDRKWSELLKVSKLVFELSSTHNELNSDNPGQWRRGHGSATVVEEERSSPKSRYLVGVARAFFSADRASWKLHEARLSWKRSGVVANRLEWWWNARRSHDSCDLFEEDRQRWTPIQGQARVARGRARSCLLRRSRRSPKRWRFNGATVERRELSGVRRERDEKREKHEFCFDIIRVWLGLINPNICFLILLQNELSFFVFKVLFPLLRHLINRKL